MLRSNLLVFLFFGLCVYGEDPIVEISNGKIRGEVMLTANNWTFFAFRGIPYAKPPVGNLRFQPPQEPGNWEGILDSDAKDRMCIQLSSNMVENESEDCLYINVYTSSLPTEDWNPTIPVLYFIHGGGFVTGNPSFDLYGPQYFMDFGVVVVTVSYRLGFLGFLSTADLNCPGNNGFKDQQFGLRWVQKNIHRFGGDPKKVTIFGESAGAASVGFQLLGTNGKGLFRGAIQNSGTPLGDWTIQRNPKQIAYTFATHINNTITEDNTSTKELLEFFRNLDIQEMKTACCQVFGEGFIGGFFTTLWGFAFVGTIEPEHEGAFLTELPYQKFVSGNFNVVPTLIGLNSEECLFLGHDSTLDQRMNFYDDNPENYVLPDMHISDLETKKMVGEKIRQIYLSSGPLHQNKALVIKYFSETSFDRPILKQAELESQHTRVYLYEFAYSGEMGRSDLNMDVPGTEKVVHGEDLHYLFKSANSKDTNAYPEEDLLTMKRVLIMWADFVKYQDPTPEPMDVLERKIWPPITSLENVAYFLINNTLEVKYNYKKENLDKYQYLYDTYAVPPLDTY